MLASAAYRDRVPWQQTHFFWGDERHVPPDHEDSNYRMAYEAMLAKVPIPAAHIYRIAAEHEAQQAADEYEATLPPIDILSGGTTLREAVDGGEIRSADALASLSDVNGTAWWNDVRSRLLY